MSRRPESSPLQRLLSAKRSKNAADIKLRNTGDRHGQGFRTDRPHRNSERYRSEGVAQRELNLPRRPGSDFPVLGRGYSPERRW